MGRFVPMLAAENYKDMDDIVCEGSDKEEDFKKLLELVQKGIDSEHKQWENDKKQFEDDETNANSIFDKPEPRKKLSGKQKRFFKKHVANQIDGKKNKEKNKSGQNHH